jgi:hypothetical protein
MAICRETCWSPRLSLLSSEGCKIVSIPSVMRWKFPKFAKVIAPYFNYRDRPELLPSHCAPVIEHQVIHGESVLTGDEINASLGLATFTWQRMLLRWWCGITKSAAARSEFGQHSEGNQISVECARLGIDDS